MLQLIDVKKTYKTKAGIVNALDGVSITFPETGMVFVTGKSGSGKTTLLNVIGGLDGIDGGEIFVYGKEFSKFTASEYDSYRNTLIGFIFQEYNLLPDYTIEKNVGIADELQGKKTDKEELNRILASVGIENFNARKPNQLSGGQKQRVAIARALIKNPKIIMADEPTGALDSGTGVQVVEELKRLSKEKLVIVISHDLELAKKYADRIIRLVDGKVVEDITIEDKVFESSILENGDVLTVKAGSDLTSNEKDVLAKAVKENRSIVLTSNSSIKVEKPTDEKKIEVSDEKVKLIKSKMKLRSSAMLGVKSLKVKPFRLIFTILLSAIAFAVFGVFDTIASYSRSKVVADFLSNGDFTTISVNAKEKTEDGERYGIELDDETLATIKSESGYNFKPIYSVQAFVSSLISKPQDEYLYDIETDKGVKITAKSVGRGYYAPKISGVVEFSTSERAPITNYIAEYGYSVKGKYPTIERDEEGNILRNEDGTLAHPEQIYQIAISKYLADCIIYADTNSKGVHTGKIFGDPIYDYNDLIGKSIIPSNITMATGTHAFEIVGIVDTGEIPSKFDKLKEVQVKTNDDPNQPLIDELATYLASGAEQLIFVAEGAIDASIELLKRPKAYFTAPANYLMNTYKKASQNATSKDNISVSEMFYTPESAVNNLDATKDQVLFFDDERDKLETYELKDNEVLIYYKDLKKLFAFELEKNYKLSDYDNNEGNTILDRLIYNINLSGTTHPDFQKNVKESMRIANQLKYFKEAPLNEETATAEQKQAYKEKRNHRKITLYKTIISTGEQIAYDFKVVGVYFNVRTNYSLTAMSPLVASRNTLSSLGISLRQGHYSRLIAPMQTTKTGIELANYITRTEGLTLHLYSNDVLSTLEKNETQILKFTNIFLYAALVLALFSVFMLFNYISTSINSKRNSIGVLRALGSNSGDVFKMFLTESLIISLISGILACGVSFYACQLVNVYVKDVMSMLVNFALYGVRQIVIIFGISLVTGILASIAPIIKIAREKPVDLIRRP